MMMQTGECMSLYELGQDFLTFAQTSNEDTQSWELVDDRLNTFFGATFKVKINGKSVDNKDPYFYVSLQYTNVTNHTYSDWLRNTPNNHQSETYSQRIYSDDNNNYAYSSVNGGVDENPFKNTGEFIAIGLHTVYDENLWMCEQGQITCETEMSSQTNAQNLMRTRVITTPKRGGSSYESFNNILPFPGSCCPWLTLSDDNKAEFVSPLHKIKYWFTKTDYDATITFRVDNGWEKSRWQSISFGKLTAIDDDSYLFPLYVAGGNQAITQKIWVYTPLRSSRNSYYNANVYDLDIKNICMSNSNLLYPTKFNGSTVSNFRVLSPEGIWRDIFAYTQSATVTAYYVCNATVNNWGYPLGDPVIYTDEHSGIPLSTSNKAMIDTYTVNSGFDREKSDSPLYEISVVLNGSIQNNERGVVGVVPNCLYSWSRSLISGEVTIGDKKYLCVPNGWDERLYNYRSSMGVFTQWDNDTLRDEYEDLTNPLKHRMMVHKLIIPLN